MTGRPADVVRQFDLIPTRVRRIPRGLVNTVWLVDTTHDRYVLKRATTERAPANLAFEHQLLAYLDAAGWTVPTPINGPNGTLVEAAGARWWLARWLPGRAPRPTTARYGEWAGALLARLHAATEAFSEPDPDVLRLRSVADWRFHPTAATLRSRLPALTAADSVLAHEVDQAVRVIDAELRRLPVGPVTVTHFDFHHDNLRVHRRDVGVLDFDFAHWDEAIADVATALHFTPDPAIAEAFVRGYDSVRPLTSGERAAIGPLFDARTLLHAAWLMTKDDIAASLSAIRDTLNGIGTCALA